MKLQLLEELKQQNPWLENKRQDILRIPNFRQRLQIETLLLEEWDNLWTLLIGPRRAGKTTLGKYLCEELLKKGRFQELLYLNCDLEEVRSWLSSPLFIQEAIKVFSLKSPILFIDEVQRLSSPGILLKTIADLKLPIKMMASGSSQLEIRSKVQEHLTGRHLSSLVLPLSFQEWEDPLQIESSLLYGSYPQVVDSKAKELLLGQLYQDYILKDIVETLKLGQPDAFQKVLSLVAHSSGQLVNYNQLATDCQIKIHTLRHYLSVAEQTYVISAITPFVGNKRTEITSNPIFYFLDNGFRNYALRNFGGISYRSDLGLLVESFVFQEIYKWITQKFLNYPIHYWRTKSGAEVDFVIHKNDDSILPIEAKYRNFSSPKISRAYRSFLQAYQPKQGVVITKDLIATEEFEGSEVSFIPLQQMGRLLNIISEL